MPETALFVTLCAVRASPHPSAGHLLILLSALLWSAFPVVTRLTPQTLPPLLSAALCMLFAALFFAGMMTAKRTWSDLCVRQAWAPMLLTSLCIGILYFGIMFVALRHTTAGNASILSLMEVFFAFIIVGLLLRQETVTRRTAAGAFLMVMGAVTVLKPQPDALHIGDVLVVVATVFSPIGNVFAKRARMLVGSEVIMFVRSVLSGAVLLGFSLLTEHTASPTALSSALPLLVLNGMLLFGVSKILWIEGIHRIPITTATPLTALMPASTLLLAWLLLGEPVQALQLAGLLPMAAGMLLLSSKKHKKGRRDTDSLLALP